MARLVDIFSFDGTINHVAVELVDSHRNMATSEGLDILHKESATREREYRHFKEVRTIIKLFDSYKTHGFRYAVVGGFALEAVLQEQYSAQRAEDKTLRDLDVTILDDPGHCFTEIQKQIGQLRKNGTLKLLELSLKEVHPASYQDSRQVVSSIKHTENGGYALMFRDIEVSLPEGTFTTQRASVQFPDSNEEVSFDSLSPVVLLGMYKTRFGFVKPKDRRKIALFTAVARAKGLFSERDLETLMVFEDFAKKMRKEHRLHSILMLLILLFDHHVLKSRFSHKLLPARVRKWIVSS